MSWGREPNFNWLLCAIYAHQISSFPPKFIKILELTGCGELDLFAGQQCSLTAKKLLDDIQSRGVPHSGRE
jgi:hypothetical protein